MARTRQPHVSGWLRRVQVFCCLLPLLVGQTEVLPGLLAIAAAAEGSHTTYAGATNEGFRLVLSHERGQAGRPDFLAHHQPANPLHHHGLAAKVICALAGSTYKLADHEAVFNAGGAAQQSRRELRATKHQDSAPSLALFRSAPSFIAPAARFISNAGCHERLSVPETVLGLRTTNLLL
jgi:hypothetical protein